MVYTSLLSVNKHSHEISDITELQTRLNNIPGLPISITNGGTGATTAEQARTNLGINDAITSAIANLGQLKIQYGSYDGFSSNYNNKSKTFTCDGYPVVFVASSKTSGTTVCVRGGSYSEYEYFEFNFSDNSVSISAAYGDGPTNADYTYNYFILMT